MTLIRKITEIVLSAATIGMVSAGLQGQTFSSQPESVITEFNQPRPSPQSPGPPLRPSSAEEETQESPFRYGPFVLEPDLSYLISYGTGIQAAPGKATDVTIQTLSAGLTALEGKVWDLTYTPKWVQYSSSLFRDTVDEDARLSANVAYQDWNDEFAQSYNRSSSPLIETGRQTLQQSYGTDLRGFYGGSVAQPSLEVILHQDIRFASLSPSVYDWNNEDWIHFPVAPQWDLAIGVGGGYTHEDPGFDMAYTRPEVRLIWRPATKLSVDAQAGVQETKFMAQNRGFDGIPIFTANLIYQPWQTTKVTAAALRQVEASFLVDQVTVSSSFNVQVQQRLLNHYYLTMQASTGKANYLSTGADLASVRGDQTDSLQASLNTTVFRRLNLGINASRTHNSSSVPGFGFSSNQYGVQVGLKY